MVSAEAKRKGKVGEEDEGQKGCVVAGAEGFTVDGERMGGAIVEACAVLG